MATRMRTYIALLVGGLFLLPVTASADGLMVPPPNYEVYETGQESVIFFEDGQQDMLLSASFRGNADEFAWLVPTPTIPEVNRGSWEMFVGLREITTTTTDDYRVSGFGSSMAFEASDYLSDSAVVEIERTSVGYYDITVLEARTTEGLLEWFDQNGFSYPSDGEYVLDEYIEAEWYFTAVTLTTEDLSSATATDIVKGDSLPLHFQFKTDKMVFPMQLSQVARLYSTGDEEGTPKLKENVDVTLYLISAERRSLPGFSQRYAGYISGEAVSELSYGTGGEPLINANVEERYVLTRLNRSFPVSEMTYDLYPRAEENTGLMNDKEASDAENAVLWWVTGLAAVITAVLLGAILMMARDKEKLTSKE